MREPGGGGATEDGTASGTSLAEALARADAEADADGLGDPVARVVAVGDTDVLADGDAAAVGVLPPPCRSATAVSASSTIRPAPASNSRDRLTRRAGSRQTKRR